jgi:hypothetical protein
MSASHCCTSNWDIEISAGQISAWPRVVNGFFQIANGPLRVTTLEVRRRILVDDEGAQVPSLQRLRNADPQRRVCEFCQYREQLAGPTSGGCFMQGTSPIPSTRMSSLSEERPSQESLRRSQTRAVLSRRRHSLQVHLVAFGGAPVCAISASPIVSDGAVAGLPSPCVVRGARRLPAHINQLLQEVKCPVVALHANAATATSMTI